uniref:Uncharacterized protein n=1 Tax=mine drainage metagenome TaxID=410659 RepID=E6Q8X6_9ZZZZ
MNTKLANRDEHGVIHEQSQKTKEIVVKVRKAVGWIDDNPLHEIKVHAQDDKRGVLVVEINHGNYYLVRLDEDREACFFQIRKGRDPKFSLMDPGAVVQWAEAFVAGVQIKKVGSLTWYGGILLVRVRAMPPQNSQQTVSVTTGFATGAIHGQQISATGTRVKRYFDLEWFVDGKIEIVNIDHQGQQPVSFSGKYKIVVGERGCAPGVQSAAHPPF